MIDWKRLPKIDAHIHLLPEDVIDANRGCGDTFVEYGSAQDYLTLMEQYNIEQAIIMPFNDPYMLSMDFTVESVHKNLQHMAETAQSRFFWYAEVDIRNEIDKTLSELERAITMDGCIGIKLHPTNAGYPIDGEYYDRVFRFASEQGIPVEIHSYPRTHLADDVCSPTRIRHVMVKYPQLKVSVAHLGGFQYRGLIGTTVYANISAILPDLVSKFGMENQMPFCGNSAWIN